MSASSIAAWNEYLKTFVNDLCETFPECPELFVLVSAIDAKIDDDEYSAMDTFLQEIEPHQEALTNMDERFFLTSDIDFLKKLGAQKFWTPDLEQETKDAIWNYLQTLLVMGKTIKSVPPAMLRMLEDYATKLTSQMGDDVDPSQLDLHTLGMGAMEHIQSSGGVSGLSNANNASNGTETPSMFANIMANMSSQNANAGEQQQQQQLFALAQGLQNMQVLGASTPPNSGGSRHANSGGMDRLLQRAASSSNSRGPATGNIWGQQPGPLHGNHPAFLPRSPQ